MIFHTKNICKSAISTNLCPHDLQMETEALNEITSLQDIMHKT